MCFAHEDRLVILPIIFKIYIILLIIHIHISQTLSPFSISFLMSFSLSRKRPSNTLVAEPRLQRQLPVSGSKTFNLKILPPPCKSPQPST
ncbi:hypothetical protein Hanom_Chr15g01340241 [Helianthus anomalus]